MPRSSSRFLNLMAPGDEIISSTKLYGGSITQFSETFPKFDWHVRFVDPTKPKQFKKALKKRTKAIFVESASNPDGVVCDLEAIAEIAHGAGVPLIVDNTMPTPYLCQPIRHGADIVVHSMTKYIGGHGNSMGGVIVDGGTLRLVPERQVPGADRADQGLSRHQVRRDLRRLRLRHALQGGRPARHRARACRRSTPSCC